MPAPEKDAHPLADAFAQLRGWTGSLPLPAVGTGSLAIAAVLAQIAAFWTGFNAAMAQDTSDARALAVSGLAASAVVGLLVVEWVRREWLVPWRVLAVLGLGALPGAVNAWYLPSETGGFIGGKLFMYQAFILYHGGLVCLGLLVGAFFGRVLKKEWWQLATAAPVLLMTGAHAVLLVGLFLQAPEIAAEAASSRDGFFG